jgi:hypothetical protein
MPESPRRPPERLHIPNTSKRPPSATEVVSHPGRSSAAPFRSSIKPEAHSSQHGERLEIESAESSPKKIHHRRKSMSGVPSLARRAATGGSRPLAKVATDLPE